ncbi:uncharacterized protein LOC134825134 [Bolinopsis microptera]|uniref:uncharacterized protein LOC134825134 n=1 Tax=Bolinopsis microptera TaxID=2820187 RepID=UPI00307993F7
MSTDRRLLYKLILGISKGDISGVKDSTIGPVNQARWLTLASRILRLYCSPPDNLGTYVEIILERLSIFIIKVYFKMYSAVKYKNTIIDGAKHLFDEIQLVKTFCTVDERKVANKCIQNNAWFAHPENIMIAMCGDQDREIRQKGRNILRRLLNIKEWRKEEERRRKELYELPKKIKIREFHLPLIDFDAKDYCTMARIKFEKLSGPYNPPERGSFAVYTLNYQGPTKSQEITIPPVLAHMRAEEMDQIVECRVTAEFECHSQSCERGVATTHQSVKRRRTDESQLRMALSTVGAREEMSAKVTVKRFKDDFSKFL